MILVTEFLEQVFPGWGSISGKYQQKHIHVCSHMKNSDIPENQEGLMTSANQPLPETVVFPMIM